MSQDNKGTSQDMQGHVGTCQCMSVHASHPQFDNLIALRRPSRKRKTNNAAAERKPKLTIAGTIDMNGICQEGAKLHWGRT